MKVAAHRLMPLEVAAAQLGLDPEYVRAHCPITYDRQVRWVDVLFLNADNLVAIGRADIGFYELGDSALWDLAAPGTRAVGITQSDVYDDEAALLEQATLDIERRAEEDASDARRARRALLPGDETALEASARREAHRDVVRRQRRIRSAIVGHFARKRARHAS